MFLLMVVAVAALILAGCTLRTMPEPQDAQTTSTGPVPVASPAASPPAEETSIASTADLDTALEELEMVE